MNAPACGTRPPDGSLDETSARLGYGHSDVFHMNRMLTGELTLVGEPTGESAPLVWSMRKTMSVPDP